MNDQPESVMPRVGGKRFYCECGCGVFSRRPSRPAIYKCNGCSSVYEGTPKSDT